MDGLPAGSLSRTLFRTSPDGLFAGQFRPAVNLMTPGMTMLLKGIDHIWLVGESFHRQEHAPGDGGTLLMACWYLDVLCPLSTLGRGWLPGWMFYALALRLLLLFPVLFCRLRYTEQRREALLARYRPRKTGRRLLGIRAAILAVCCLEGALMLHVGLWQWGADRNRFPGSALCGAGYPGERSVALPSQFPSANLYACGWPRLSEPWLPSQFPSANLKGLP